MNKNDTVTPQRTRVRSDTAYKPG